MTFIWVNKKMRFSFAAEQLIFPWILYVGGNSLVWKIEITVLSQAPPGLHNYIRAMVFAVFSEIERIKQHTVNVGDNG